MHIVILGNGIAGSTVARKLRQNPDLRITMISDEAPYPYSRPALMYVFMGHLTHRQTELYERNSYRGIELIEGSVQHVNPARKFIRYTDRSGHTDDLSYDRLVIATGSIPRRLNVPGESLEGVQGLYHRQDLTRLENRLASTDGPACIVGGGLIGVELAEMLHSRRRPLTMLVRESSYWNSVLLPEESAFVSREIERHVRVLYNRQVISFNGAAAKPAGSETVTGSLASVTTDHETLPVNLAGVTIGVEPNLSALQSSGITLDRGVVVDGFFRTSAPDVYAIGDCAQINGRIEQIWYTARHQAETLVAQWTDGAGQYVPEPFYNSAKFFSLEYIVTGQIRGRSLLYQDERHLLRLCFDRDHLIGINTLGLRLRQAAAGRLIAEGAGTATVMDSLPELCFDPEFSGNWRRLRHGLKEKEIS
jgi:NADPH-dependent 2,4-dienoyl-CoA reductase/sulfur reductase-like enzyme